MAWSRSASEVMMIAFLPLVSAKSWRSGRQLRKRRAVSAEPVRMTASTRGSVMSARPTSSSGHGTNWSTPRGMPASHSARARCQPTSTASGAGVRSAPVPGAGGVERAFYLGAIGQRVAVGNALRERPVAGFDLGGAFDQVAGDLQGDGLGRPGAPARDHGVDPFPVGGDGPVCVGLVGEGFL